MLNFAIVRASEKELLDKIRDANEKDTNVWKIPNLIFPLATILLAMACNVAFSANRWSAFAYINLVINGSLPLIAINQISALGLHVFKFDKSQEKSLGIEETGDLRTKLLLYSIAICVVAVIAFAHQVINNPFKELLEPIIALAISILLVMFSSNVAKKTFLLQGDFIAKTFAENIKDEMKKHGNNWSAA